MIWTKQPIKKEITALDAQGKALNVKYNLLNSKVVSPTVTTIGSYSDLKTAISTVAANMSANSFENMSISLSAAFPEFPNGGNYGVRIHKEQDNDHISALIQGYNNEVKFLRYKNGTWSIDDFALNSDIATHDFGTNTVANHQTAIVAYAATLEDLTVKNISFLVNENAGEFSQTRYVGQLIKTNNNRINVELRQGLNNIRPIIGKYTNGTWEWDKLALDSNLLYQIGDTYTFNGAQVPFRAMNDKSAILFRFKLPKACASNVNSFSIQITENSPTWFTGSDALGSVLVGASAGNILLTGKQTVQFTLPTKNTISEAGFGICELNATITFSA